MLHLVRDSQSSDSTSEFSSWSPLDLTEAIYPHFETEPVMRGVFDADLTARHQFISFEPASMAAQSPSFAVGSSSQRGTSLGGFQWSSTRESLFSPADGVQSDAAQFTPLPSPLASFGLLKPAAGIQAPQSVAGGTIGCFLEVAPGVELKMWMAEIPKAFS